MKNFRKKILLVVIAISGMVVTGCSTFSRVESYPVYDYYGPYRVYYRPAPPPPPYYRPVPLPPPPKPAPKPKPNNRPPRHR